MSCMEFTGVGKRANYRISPYKQSVGEAQRVETKKSSQAGMTNKEGHKFASTSESSLPLKYGLPPATAISIGFINRLYQSVKR